MAKLKGSTLVEVVIALVILMISFGIGMMVIETVLNANRNALKYRVNLKLETIAQEVQRANHLIDETITTDEYWIEQKIVPYPINKRLFLLSLKAFDHNDRLILTRKELLYVP